MDPNRVEHDGRYWSKDNAGTPHWWNGTEWVAWQRNPDEPEPPPGFVGTVRVDASEPPPRVEAPKGNPVVRTIGWILGFALFFLPLVPALMRGGEGYDAAYESGRALGGMTLGLLIGAVLWRVIHRSNPAKYPSVSPWILFIAFFAGFAIQVPVNLSNQAEEQERAEYDAATYLPEIPGYTYGKPPPEAVEQFEQSLTSEGLSVDEVYLDFELKQLLQDGEVVGVVSVVVPRTGGDSFEEAGRDYIAGIESSASGATETDIEGTTVHIFQAPGGELAAWIDDPVFAAVFRLDGSDPAELVPHFLD